MRRRNVVFLKKGEEHRPSLDVGGVLTAKEDEPIDSYDKRGTTTRQNIDSYHLAVRCPRNFGEISAAEIPLDFSVKIAFEIQAKYRPPIFKFAKTNISFAYALFFETKRTERGTWKQDGINITCKWKICETWKDNESAKKYKTLGNRKLRRSKIRLENYNVSECESYRIKFYQCAKI